MFRTIRRWFRKNVARPTQEVHFKVCRFLYRNPRWYKVYRWSLVTLGHLFLLLMFALFSSILGLGITECITKYTIWNAIVTWYTLIGWGTLGLMWCFGFVVVVVTCIWFFDDHIPDVRSNVRKKLTTFRYDMEYEISERLYNERVRQEELEREAIRMAAKGNPKWEV